MTLKKLVGLLAVLAGAGGNIRAVSMSGVLAILHFISTLI